MSTLADDIHLTRWGTDGPTVVMVHGGGQGGSAGGDTNYDRQKPLADRWQLVVPDRPGHGKTPTRGPEDMEVEGAWIAELLGDGAHLVGHSFGGCCATAAAAIRPEAVKSLTLIEAPVFSAAKDDPAALQFKSELNDMYDANADPGALLMTFITECRIPVMEIDSPPPTPEEIKAMGEGLRSLRFPQNWDSTEQLKTIREHEIPFLAVTADWSPGEEAISDGLARELNGERLVVKTGHHFPQFGQDEFNAAFEKFLTAAEERWDG